MQLLYCRVVDSRETTTTTTTTSYYSSRERTLLGTRRGDHQSPQHRHTPYNPLVVNSRISSLARSEKQAKEILQNYSAKMVDATSSDNDTAAATPSPSGDVDNDDASLIQQAEEFYSIERLLDTAKLLRQVKDKSLLTPKHEWMLRWAGMVERGMEDLMVPPDNEGSDWTKQGETHGHRDFTVYYNYSEDKNHLTCRIDSVIESSLLIPIIAVFNESDLYDTWMPSFKKPIKIGIQDSTKIKEEGRGNQIIRVTASMAWPFKMRESTQHAVAVDVIEDQGAIAIQVLTETPEDNPDIPESSPDVVRIDLSCCMLLRGCPPDHPLLSKSRHKYPEDEELILISMKTFVDPHIAGIPVSIINWFSRTVFGRMWSSLLGVAEGVREGKRAKHKEAIDQNPELYAWIEQRIGVMMEKVKEQSRTSSSIETT